MNDLCFQWKVDPDESGFQELHSVTSQYTSFEYDGAGNITETKLFTDTSTVVETRTYNDVNEITANSVDDGISVVNWTYGHDANGNLTSRSDGTDTWTYTWDDENRLIEVEKNSTTQATYQYDSNSRLIQRVAGGTTTNYTWDGWDLVKEEKTGTITETTRYAVLQGMVTSFDRNGSRYYLHGDGLSSSQLVTNSSGNQAARIIYGAWGNELYSNDTVPNGLDARFVGGLGVRNDATTGLIYMRHRWYMPEMQRFVSRDPIGLMGGNNLYRYGAGNPMMFTDPLGLLCSVKVVDDINLTITIPIAYWSNSLTPAQVKQTAKKFNKAIGDYWSGQKGKYHVTIKIVMFNETGNELNKDINHVQLFSGTGRSYSARRGNRHIWYAGQPAETGAHEAGHLMKLKDGYIESGNRPNKPGVPQDDIMGNFLLYKMTPKVYESHIQQIINDCSSK